MTQARRFWVIKAKPEFNDIADILSHKGRVGTWSTKKPPKNWCKGDGFFIWETAPALRIAGLAVFAGEDEYDPEYGRRFRVKYRTTLLEQPVGIDLLRKTPGVKGASFLRPVNGTVFEVPIAGVRPTLDLIAKLNPGERALCEEWKDSITMAEEPAYLLTWNPDKFKDWADDDIDRQVENADERGFTHFDWSTGRTRKPARGNRVFMTKVGRRGRGLFASGEITKGAFEDPDDPDFGYKVDVRWDVFLDPRVGENLLFPPDLGKEFSRQTWTPQSSGIALTKVDLGRLSEAWMAHARRRFGRLNEGHELEGVEEGRIRRLLVKHRSREARLRHQKLAEFRRVHGRVFCEACGFSFFDAYGVEFAEVHHIRPLSSRAKPSRTKSSDLAVLCANCHRMCHLGAKSIGLEQLRKTVAKRRRKEKALRR